MKMPQGLDPTKIRKVVKAIVICEDEDAWEEAHKDIKELISIMSNNKRQVTIIEIEEVTE